MLVLALAAAAGAGVTVTWLVDQIRCRRRNEQGECAACGVGWAAASSGDSYLIHGRLVCEDCAEKAKRRIPWHFGILAAAAAVATGFIVADSGVFAMILFPAASTIVMALGVVQLMKLANRDAQRRIVAGEFPDFQALRADASTELKRSLPEIPSV